MIRLFEPGFFDKLPDSGSGLSGDAARKISALDSTTLAEAASWCNTQTLTGRPVETPDIRRRRAMVSEAGELYAKGHKCGERYPDGPHFQKASALFAQADMSSLVMLRCQLRSRDLLQDSVSKNLSTENIAEALATVVTKRRQHLQNGNIRTMEPAKDAGKLLYYWPHENLACGAAEYSSDGFFNQNNVPPWDTWISFDGLTLTGWVPAILVPLAQAGIDANPEGCISWTQ